MGKRRGKAEREERNIEWERQKGRKEMKEGDGERGIVGTGKSRIGGKKWKEIEKEGGLKQGREGS